MSMKFGLGCLASLAVLGALFALGFYLRIRWQRPITLSEFKARLSKLL